MDKPSPPPPPTVGPVEKKTNLPPTTRENGTMPPGNRDMLTKNIMPEQPVKRIAEPVQKPPLPTDRRTSEVSIPIKIEKTTSKTMVKPPLENQVVKPVDKIPGPPKPPPFMPPAPPAPPPPPPSEKDLGKLI